MIVAGQHEFGLDDVEILSISETSSCAKPTKFPSQAIGTVSTFVNEMPLVCGGFPYTSDCFAYDFEYRVWVSQKSLNVERAYAAEVMLNESHWWITGGENGGG